MIIAALLLSSAAFIWLQFSKPTGEPSNPLQLGSVLCFFSLALILMMNGEQVGISQEKTPSSPTIQSQTPTPALPSSLTQWKALSPASQQAINIVLLKDLRQRQVFKQPIYRESDYLEWAQALQQCLEETKSEPVLMAAAESCVQNLLK